MNELTTIDARVGRHYANYLKFGRLTVEEFWLLGGALIERKAACKHGEWLPYLAARGIYDRAARKAMQFHRGFKSVQLADLGSVDDGMKRLRAPIDGDTWQTPDSLLDVVRRVFDPWPIFTDPASTASANQRVRARHFYAYADDGLDPANPWYGCVFMNPPFSQSGKWVDRFLTDRVMVQGIALLPDRQANWRTRLFREADAVCILDDRVQFIHPDTGIPSRENDHGNLLAYVGMQAEIFDEQFSPHGAVRVRERPEGELIPLSRFIPFAHRIWQEMFDAADSETRIRMALDGFSRGDVTVKVLDWFDEMHAWAQGKRVTRPLTPWEVG